MKSIPQISCDELVARLADQNPPILIDVLPEEEFGLVHLPGAKNACVYNVTFLDDVAKLVPDRAKSVVLYGSSALSLASTTAAEKLVAAGYGALVDYRGGIEDWLSAGHPTEGNRSDEKPESKLRDGMHEIDRETSKVEWTGRNLTGAHSGILKLSDGSIEVAGGQPLRGSFTLDMNSIANADIEDGDMRQLLIEHLKSDDFFDVQRFPEAKFRISKCTAVPGAKPGRPNYEITGELTMKGVTREIVFPAMLGLTTDGVLAADAHFDIDRTQWNVLYGSGKFYEKLGKHLVNDEISLALKLITRAI